MGGLKFERSFARYLAAKRTVDDRALNRRVWDAMCNALPGQTASAPLQVIEVGAGTGAMIDRLVGQGILQHAHYLAIDVDERNLHVLRQQIPAWQAHAPGAIIESETADIFEWIGREPRRCVCDLFIAHAVLDLFNLPRALPQLLALLKPGGLCYFTLNFDGATIFEPEIDPAFDAEIERLYHQTMDGRAVDGELSGDSRSGRHLFQLLRQNRVDIIAAGSSDWVVYADRAGYHDDEAYFLHFIVDTLRGALENQPQLISHRAEFLNWIKRRHAQIERGELVYIAHQIDFLGRKSDT
jgi:SAM-dependent methyltransferase